jgi:hypothetical protein
LGVLQDPVVTPDGIVYSREVILENLLKQKKAIGREVKAWEEQEKERAADVRPSSCPTSPLEPPDPAWDGSHPSVLLQVSWVRCVAKADPLNTTVTRRCQQLVRGYGIQILTRCGERQDVTKEGETRAAALAQFHR